MDKTLAERALAIVQRAGDPSMLGELDGETYIEIPALVARLSADGTSVDIIGLRAGWEATPVARLIDANVVLASRDAEIAVRDAQIAELRARLAASSVSPAEKASIGLPSAETPVSADAAGCPFCDDNTRRSGQSINRHIFLAHRATYDAWKALGRPTRPVTLPFAAWSPPNWAAAQIGKEEASGDAGTTSGVAP